MKRLTLAGAILASLLLHAVAVLGFLAVSQYRQAALPTPTEPNSTANEMPTLEVEVLADPRAGTQESAEATEAEPAPDSSAEQVALPPDLILPMDPTPPVLAPPPPAEQAALPPPSPHAPPPHPTVAPTRLPPAQPRAGATAEGRVDGITDIILGENTVPPSEDPTAQNIPPRYPPEAARRGQQGTVELQVVVGTDGGALTVSVAVSSGFPLLDRAARDAVAKWRFRPGRAEGIAIPLTIPLALQFILVGS